MHWQRRIGGRRIGGPAIVAALSCFGGYGCEAQVGQDYSGEVMLELRGHVVAPEEPADDLIPALLTFSEGTAADADDLGPAVLANITKGKLEGIFPSDFKLSVAGPPPHSERYGFAMGYVVLVPRDQPASFEYASRTGYDNPGDDSTSYPEHRSICMRSGACVERDYECTEELCELVSTEGERRDPSTRLGFGYSACSNGICYSMAAECVDDPSCYREVRRCDVHAPGSKISHFTAGDTVQTCTLVAESGDTSVRTLEDSVMVAADLIVFYVQPDRVNDDVKAVGLGPGYNLLRVSAASSLERFQEYASCMFDRDVARARESSDVELTISLFDEDCPALEVIEDPAAQLVDVNLSGVAPF